MDLASLAPKEYSSSSSSTLKPKNPWKEARVSSSTVPRGWRLIREKTLEVSTSK